MPPELNRFVLDNLVVVLIAIAALILLLIVVVLVLGVRVGRAARRYRALVRDTHGGSLQEVLDAHVERVMAVGGQIEDVRRLYQSLQERSQGSLQHVGMVRFNPFDDTGSDQSFAIALLDDRRDGVVISSLHGRTSTRVFAKPVEGGTSRHSLSEEEAQAIQIAVEGTQAIATTA